MWLSDFRVVTPDRVLERGSVRVEAGCIVEVAETPQSGAALSGDGLLLLPGFVDMHGDMVEREVEPRPNVRMPMELGLRDLDRRLAASGVTTAYAAVSFHPGSAYGHIRHFDQTSAIIRALKSMADVLKVDHKVHARFEITFPDALRVVEGLIAEGAVDLVSLTDHTPGQGQYRDIEAHVARVAREKGLSQSDAESEVARRIAQKHSTAGDMAATLRAISATCRAHGVALASHDDDTVEKVALMQVLGAGISEFPVTVEAATEARARGLATAMGAPNALRGQSYSGNLSARAAHELGLLDILASDYHPSALLPAVLELAKADPQGLAGSTRLATLNPAQALGLRDRGAIAPGMLADLVIADGTGIGHVRATLRAGAKIFSDGSIFLARAA
ncbi:alpha-D-ribose 1-methylphosphonate 5-triphosphate diphosphatase [Cypionkella sp.]|uniref:alpha-D-ribose 1-methylphosphonate 5-triphosphate diphosphatase n=1 Tax=Cypionkella sp. TaxID=2811411 RepID=UPI00271B75AC|nr:alpha-D-ribose 1-methylphosphonate 5-triphosphate diphosphatase [Cypionkella sp.]MDO8985934.1 alpha-D-ribose 1-methylphosphonate 5-triphosphate diphosphatase [Cypionkella sp.]MDP1577859.1 alpha-D-ribose 1-methylphosphonate 5-triphosphate diphosphatase [Cypionkella sp.]MDP2049917.1 alpha-D-ribose 1-methylphosphonate 5-triphosphate diphosphatase [Cypionkella sp.]